MPTNPIVSVVMPAYNVELYVEEAVRSILNQTFCDFEFIIVDDGSTDRTPEILRTFTDPRIRLLFNEKNEGNYPARNRGCRLARGKYIAVMDADDVAYPNRLETEVRYLETHLDVQAIGSGWHFRDGLSRTVNPPTVYESILLFLLDNSCFLHPSLLIRKEALQAVGGYDEHYVYAGDYELLCRLALRGRIENIPDVLMAYRWHPGQITQSHRPSQRLFAEEARRNYHQRFVALYKTVEIGEADLYDVGFSALGECICLYVYAAYTQSKQIEERADSLLDYIFQHAIINPAGNQVWMLCCAGCGLLYLLRNRFVEGNEDVVLSEIDRRLATLTAEQVLDSATETVWQAYRSRRHLGKGASHE